MATLGVLEYLISVKDNGSIDSAISKSEKKVKGFGDKLSAWTLAKGQMIGNFATKAISSAAEVMKGVFKDAYNAYASFQQLEGGIETIFKKDVDPRAFNLVMENANKAFQTTGQSANAYMETVTAFSASLLQGLKGDTYRAAEVADMAMQDMSDNANKMGTSMESIENAYKGFAKQNYTMLDNLKIGYGGTRSEMQRLLKDASKLTGKKYNIKNLADVYEAIHAIQDEMGITGTTANEASTTVEGSTKAMKASWENLLVAISRGKNIKKATKDFTKSLKTMLKNATPVVRQIAESIPKIIKEIMPEVGNIINEIGRGLFGKDWDITINWIQNAWTDVKKAFDTATEWVGNAYKVTVKWLQQAWKTVSDAFTEATAWVDRAWNDTVTWVQNAWDTVSDAFTEAGKWIDKTFKSTIEWVQNAWKTVSDAFTEAGKWAGKTFDATIKWVQNAWDDVSNAIAEVAKGTWENVVNFTLGLFKGVGDFIKSIPKAINVAVNFLKGDGTVKSSTGETAWTPDSGESLSDWYLSHHHQKGSWNIPYDNYPALLHRGEMVLNKSQARQFRDGGYGGYSMGESISKAVDRAMSKVYVMLNGNKVGDLTTKRIKKNINASSYNKLRAMGG